MLFAPELQINGEANGKREHDDCVMALAIAQYIRPQQSFLVVKAPKEAQREKAEYESQVERFLSF